MDTDAPPTIAVERRTGDRRVEPTELSPEFLAVLLLCGGEARASDRAAGEREPRDRRARQDA